ncbi:Bicyclomycin resistance protein [Pseudoruegeria aquimaris]|uniref:Bicyclomycin resistance protein n=1 Tax=Pseudoruegeria aquimaris TaxID=393663 RepID=A0A1Y5TGV3_9RHOB|nr:MFS transporter [Pseudoruegeria aquimaris]SLN61738.1 Bicyclomycin resistance protein [Pseudoruegeria aquimaris]
MAAKHAFSRFDALLFLGGITALSAVTTDIILPATGVVAREFAVEERLGALLVAAYFLAYAVGQMFWGLFSDAYGRRRALVVSLVGFSAASFACAWAPDFKTLIALRVLQGLMAGTPVIARAMVRDVARGSEAGQLMSILAAILTAGTMIAPVLGSGLLVLFDWPAMFIGLGLMGLAFLAYGLFALEETGQRRPERFSFGFVGSAGRRLLGMRAFLQPMLLGGFTFAGYASILSMGAVITEEAYGVSPAAFGSIFAIAALANLFGAVTVNRYLKGRSLPDGLRLAVIVLAAAAAVNGVLTLFAPPLPLFWLAVCFYVYAFGMVFPLSISSALEPAGDTPGFASSLLGTIQMTIGAGGAVGATLLYDGSHRAISLSMLLAGLIGLACYRFLRPGPTG